MTQTLGQRMHRLRGEERLREIRRVISDWRASGQSQLAFCKQVGVSTQAFGRWLKQAAASGAASPDVPTFVEVGVERVGTRAGFDVALPGGARVHVPAEFDEHRLQLLLRVVSAAC